MMREMLKQEDPKGIVASFQEGVAGVFRRDNTARDSVLRKIKGLLPGRLQTRFLNTLYTLRDSFESGIRGIPSNISIETTTDCNRTCSYCPLGDSARKAERSVHVMEPETFSFIIDDLAKAHFSGKIALQGYGEPLKDKLIIERVREVRAKLPKAHIVLNSNGDYLNSQKMQELIEAGLSKIYVTNHSGLVEPSSKIQKILDDPIMQGYISYFSKLSRLRNRGGAVDLKEFEEDRIATSLNSSDCISVLHSMTINVDGTVSFCHDDFDRKSEGILGVVGVGKSSIEDVWTSEKSKKYRANLKSGNSSHPTCLDCNIHKSKIPKKKG